MVKNELFSFSGSHKNMAKTNKYAPNSSFEKFWCASIDLPQTNDLSPKDTDSVPNLSSAYKVYEKNLMSICHSASKWYESRLELKNLIDINHSAPNYVWLSLKDIIYKICPELAEAPRTPEQSKLMSMCPNL